MLGKYVREERLLTLEEAVRKMTSTSAARSASTMSAPARLMAVSISMTACFSSSQPRLSHNCSTADTRGMDSGC